MNDSCWFCKLGAVHIDWSSAYLLVHIQFSEDLGRIKQVLVLKDSAYGQHCSMPAQDNDG